MRIRHIQTAVAALLTAFCLLPLASCGTSNTSNDDTIAVVASVNQWGSLAEELGGDAVQVTSILDSSSVNAHDFEPKTSDIAKISKATIALINGAGYDTWAEKSVSSEATSINAAEIVGAKDGDNPHLWFSKNARQGVAQQLTDAFIAAQPDKKNDFEQRLSQWQQRENTLEELIASFRKAHSSATYAACESVAAYLMDDMGLKDITPEGYAKSAASEGESAPADLKEFQELLSSGKTNLLIVNPQESSTTTDMLQESATQGKVPTLSVTEQMPEGTSTLVDWITSLVNSASDSLQ